MPTHHLLPTDGQALLVAGQPILIQPNYKSNMDNLGHGKDYHNSEREQPPRFTKRHEPQSRTPAVSSQPPEIPEEIATLSLSEALPTSSVHQAAHSSLESLPKLSTEMIPTPTLDAYHGLEAVKVQTTVSSASSTRFVSSMSSAPGHEQPQSPRQFVNTNR